MFWPNLGRQVLSSVACRSICAVKCDTRGEFNVMTLTVWAVATMLGVCVLNLKNYCEK